MATRQKRSPVKKKQVPKKAPPLRSRAEKEATKKKGDLRGFFQPLPRGRPPKPKPAPVLLEPELPTTDPPQKKAKRGPYVRWNSAENIKVMEASLQGTSEGEMDPVDISLPVVPRSTLNSIKKRISTDGGKRKDLDLYSNNRRPSLTTRDDQEILAATASYRDKANNGMSRKELIEMILSITSTVDWKAAENHLDYLIRQKKLPNLKRNGRVVAAQKTTTKRSQIIASQQFRWHALIESLLEEQKRVNLPAHEFEKVKAHFSGNADETCIMSNEGTIKVVGSAEKKKHEKNMDDSRDSITILRSGLASGTSGPWIFLAKGKTLDFGALKNLPKKGAPAYSKVIMTPNACRKSIFVCMSRLNRSAI